MPLASFSKVLNQRFQASGSGRKNKDYRRKGQDYSKKVPVFFVKN